MQKDIECNDDRERRNEEENEGNRHRPDVWSQLQLFSGEFSTLHAISSFHSTARRSRLMEISDFYAVVYD